MKSININYRKNTIEITAAFAKTASGYGKYKKQLPDIYYQRC